MEGVIKARGVVHGAQSCSRRSPACFSLSKAPSLLQGWWTSSSSIHKATHRADATQRGGTQPQPPLLLAAPPGAPVTPPPTTVLVGRVGNAGPVLQQLHLGRGGVGLGWGAQTAPNRGGRGFETRTARPPSACCVLYYCYGIGAHYPMRQGSTHPAQGNPRCRTRPRRAPCPAALYPCPLSSPLFGCPPARTPCLTTAPALQPPHGAPCTFPPPSPAPSSSRPRPWPAAPAATVTPGCTCCPSPAPTTQRGCRPAPERRRRRRRLPSQLVRPLRRSRPHASRAATGPPRMGSL